ncbi:hypothetical protein HPP92_004689 [Vanilla planifolia]|uniref:Uncharacterized protein n=1 Tax=Vanilla planifolia TaxID=51239 RepID=A0A835RSN6_VANPL|nr:hypothetical protein HPP92_005034 [Vanilla planifolia]KAG0493695.1 hypothetical protein HPP92_004689 [Vanilla planifolia]
MEASVQGLPPDCIARVMYGLLPRRQRRSANTHQPHPSASDVSPDYAVTPPPRVCHGSNSAAPAPRRGTDK